MAESATTAPEAEGKGKKPLKRRSSDDLLRPDKGKAKKALKRQRSSDEFIRPDMSEKLRVVLLGNNQSERNAVGDLLLGQTGFSGHDALTDCMIGSGQVENNQMVVINTPDLLHPNISPIGLSEKIQSCLRYLAPGPHVFLLVLKPEDFTEEQRLKLQNVLQEFSDRSFDHSFVLVSTPRKQHEGPMINYMQHPQLSEMIRKCRYRHLQQRNLELPELLARLGQVVKENYGQSYDTSDTMTPKTMNLVLIGRTGVGKSTSGNTILDRPIFPAKSSQSSVTKSCQKEHGEVDGRPVVVVDTPGLFDTSLSQEDLDQEMTQFINMLDLGLHVFLLVLRIGPPTKEMKETVKLIQTALGKNAKKFTIILFTGGDSLENDKQSIEEYIKNDCDDDSLNNLIHECGGRYHVFNNLDKNNHKQVSDLLMKVEKMVKVNGGGCYTTKMFQEAGAAPKEVQNMEALTRKYEDKLQEMKRKMEEKDRNYREEMRKQQEVWEMEKKGLQYEKNQLINDLIEAKEAEIKDLIEAKEAEINELRLKQAP